MPYRRYSKRRYYRRRAGRRVKFSRYATYRYRSSKAQAKQIYSLNKKLNRVYNNVKPETQTYFSTDVVVNGTIESSASTQTNDSGMVDLITHKLGCFNGRYARIKSFKIWGMMENNGTGASVNSYNNTIGLRIILFALKSEKYGTTSVVDIIANINSGSHTPDYYMTSPLAPGFSTRYRLLKDKRYYLKPVNGTTKPISISMKYPRSLCCSTGMANTSSYYYPKNSVLCCWFLCNMGDSNVVGHNGCDFGLSLKVAYCDDNYTVNSGAKSIPAQQDDLIVEPLESEETEDNCLDIFDEDK